VSSEFNLEGSIAQSPYAGRSAKMFPRLTPEQIARLVSHGHKITTEQGQILEEPGDRMKAHLVEFLPKP